ncbi:DUF1015 domain-containing protein [Exiguobacterium sp. SH3S1]|uniref:DUF1015 domain-containing protein n=1 Tax=Exiguobacterium sp. SH3S1 TaxID=2510955 RepID=UPI00103FD1BA|nr:DUF1015 family protein [Exiguobacterium sp. SH3S1]TCI64739.1 DUF1015 domain-containing protein [Exiguobacterium sp. SH3S1]
MVIFKPFKPYMPTYPEAVAADPYDVVNVEQARGDVERRPNSFLSVDKPELFAADLSLEAWGRRARAELERLYATELTEQANGFYVYRLTNQGRRQTGLVATFSVADYEAGRIKIHEHTREVKERERVEHVAATKAHTGPILLSHEPDEALRRILEAATNERPLFSFTDNQGVLHEGYAVPSKDQARVIMIGATIPSIYIADGHHRAKAAAVVAARELPEGESKLERDHFLGVLFPSDELTILPYHRLLTDVTPEEVAALLDGISFSYEVVSTDGLVVPQARGSFGLSYRGKQYELTKRQSTAALDVATLQRDILEPYFRVDDVRTDKRIDFVGGSDAVEQLERLAERPDVVVLTCHATAMGELMQVADESGQMPPKSTWFDPKLKSGLFIHRFD